MNEKLLAKFNEVEKNHWWWEGRRALLKQLLASDNPIRILDVGCGTGETLTFLKGMFLKTSLYGVDTSSKAVRFSKKRGHKNIFKSNALKLPFRNNFFDAVLFLDVLEHIKDHQKAVNEAKRVLKHDGKIVITSPALNFIWSKHDARQGHERRYTKTEVLKLAKRSKMNSVFVSYFNFLLSPPIIAIRLLGKIPAFSFLAEYDNGVNYDIAFKSLPNSILKAIFVFEVNMIQYVKYPFGISMAAVFKKK